jgi:hypothetical protein
MHKNLSTTPAWSRRQSRRGSKRDEATVGAADSWLGAGPISCRTVAVNRHTIRPRMDGKQYGTNRGLTRAIRHSECRSEVARYGRGTAHNTRACIEGQTSQHVSARLCPCKQSRSSYEHRSRLQLSTPQKLGDRPHRFRPHCLDSPPVQD